MWKALQTNSIEQVRAILSSSPQAAAEPIWEHEFEPTLCCAVRLQCDVTIVQLLLEHGANPHDTDMCGRTALQLLPELEAPCEANLWEKLLLGDVSHLPIPTGAPLALGTFPKISWYDSLLLESRLEEITNDHEKWHHKVKLLLGAVDKSS